MNKKAALILMLPILAGCATNPDWSPRPPQPPASANAFNPAAEADIYLGVVNGLIQQGRYEAAIAFLDQYRVSQAPNPRYQLLRGNALTGAKRYAEAIAAYQVAINSVFAAQAYSGLGRTAAAQNHWDAAAENFRRASLLDPSNAAYLNNLGYAKLHQDWKPGTLDAAETDLKRAYELNPDSATIRNNLILAANLSKDKGRVSQLLSMIADAQQRNRVRDFSGKWKASEGGIE